jgi:hypothetical protein
VGRGQISPAPSRSKWCLSNEASGSTTWSCGIVTIRQLPETDKGAIFVTLEDEIGSVDIIACGDIRVRAAWCCCAPACSRRPGSGRPSTTART